MIDFQTETLLTFTEACDLVPRRRRGRKLHVSTLYRWRDKGVGGVRLEWVSIGGSPRTTAEALHRFFVAVAEAKCPAPPIPAPTTKPLTIAGTRAAQTRRRIDVGRELDRIGI